MRKVMSMLLVCTLPFIATAQQQITVNEGEVKMGKTKMWTFSAAYPYDKGHTKNVIVDNFDAAGVKRTGHKKGVQKYMAAKWNTISSSKGDYYYRIRSKKGRTIVYFAASKGYDNFITSANDSTAAAKMKKYLIDLDTQIANAIKLEEKEKEMAAIAKRNEELTKELNKGKEQQAQKAGEVKQLQKSMKAPDPVK